MFSISSYLYYLNEESKLKSKREFELKSIAKEFEKTLKSLHFSFKNRVEIDSNGVKIEFLDIDNRVLASNIDSSKDCYRYELSQSFLGVKYILLDRDLNVSDRVLREIFYLFLTLFPVMIFISIFLAKLAIRPIKETNLAIKEFIRDTTHEMNTPLSSILANCEYFDRENLSNRALKSLDRISMSAKVLNSLYQDLKYISFYEKIESKDEFLEVSEILRERVEYFSTLIELKSLRVEFNLNPTYLTIDREKFTRVVDNLISNAIKYSKKSKKIYIESSNGYFLIQDEGVGIDRENQRAIFERFKRFDSANSGFGVGLNLVWQICREYNIEIELKSSNGSEFKFKWKN